MSYKEIKVGSFKNSALNKDIFFNYYISKRC